MAKRRSTKRTAQKVAKAAEKNPKLFLAIFVVLVIALICVCVLWKLGYIQFGIETQEPAKTQTTEETYDFSLDTKYYSVTYDGENGNYIVGEETTTPLEGANYILVVEKEDGLYLQALVDSMVTETKMEALPSTVELDYVWTYKSTTSKATVVTKYSGGITENVMYTDFQIHFMMLGNDKAGDSIYIKAGDTDVLIDAGSTAGSATTTMAYFSSYCTDKNFEYVIATHGDADHISGFPNIFEQYSVDTVIDFTSETSDEFAAYKEELSSNSKAKRSYFVATTKTTATYGNYLTARDTHAKNHYTAGDCYLNQNGGKRQYQLSDNVTMDILYNYYYYDNDNNDSPDTIDENNFSVLTLFTYTKNGISHKFFLGGDLELEGEEKLAEYYDGSTTEKTLGKVDLYKAGHHGSKTSSNDCLLDILQPKLCVVCCCCGTDEYTGATDNQFPTQQFINRISKWTDMVYVTTVMDTYEILTAEANAKGNTTKTGVAVGGQYLHSSGFKALNGNIVVSCGGQNIGLWASNNLTKLKDTEWFNSSITLDGNTRKMRTWPSN